MKIALIATDMKIIVPIGREMCNYNMVMHEQINLETKPYDGPEATFFIQWLPYKRDLAKETRPHNIIGLI